MLGAIIGDIVGSTREWHNIKTEKFELVPKGSRFTDDTVMTLAVAEWLMTDPQHRPETLVETMQRLGRKYIYAGYGRRFSTWLLSINPRPYGSFGNGLWGTKRRGWEGDGGEVVEETGVQWVGRTEGRWVCKTIGLHWFNLGLIFGGFRGRLGLHWFTCGLCGCAVVCAAFIFVRG